MRSSGGQVHALPCHRASHWLLHRMLEQRRHLSASGLQ
jgi:hypothetical protein